MKNWMGLGLILVVMPILLLRHIGDVNLVYPDAERILMDGVFIMDFFRAMPLNRVYEFITGYYAQYPALSLGYRMPFFPMVEALFNAVFGVHIWSSRLAILTFAYAGAIAWYKLIERIFDKTTAFWSTLIVMTTPYVVQWGWYTMGELSFFAMCMVTAYFFYRYTENFQPKYLYFATVFLGLSVFTKQTALFMLLWFVPYLAVKAGLRDCLKRKEIWVSLALCLIIFAAFAVITLRLDDWNIMQSVGIKNKAYPAWRLRWDNLQFYPAAIQKDHLTGPVLILGLLGLGASIYKKDSRIIFFLLLILSNYLFFTYLVAKEPRYAICWIPAFSLFAALPAHYLKKIKPLRTGVSAILAAVVLYQAGHAYAMPPRFASGYHEAAEYVMRHRISPMVFFDGHLDGYFIYFIRRLDRERSVYILRGDKLLKKNSVEQQREKSNDRKSWILEAEEIEEIFSRYGVEYAVVESTPYYQDKRAQPELRKWLAGGGFFELVKEIPVKTNWTPLEGKTLKIYRRQDFNPNTAELLQYEIPLVGQKIKARING
ncbi:MAG TPA: glycosyltransferase family 39 protein [bacterium]|nr:glycosyltransferase family 39 protein [bacterium]